MTTAEVLEGLRQFQLRDPDIKVLSVHELAPGVVAAEEHDDRWLICFYKEQYRFPPEKSYPLMKFGHPVEPREVSILDSDHLQHWANLKDVARMAPDCLVRVGGGKIDWNENPIPLNF